MDKIFKQRFDKFEPKVPDSMLDNILKGVQKENAVSSAPKSSYVKMALWASAALIAIISTILLIPNQTKETHNKNNNTENSIVNISKEKERSKLVSSDKIKNNLKEQSPSSSSNLVSRKNTNTKQSFEEINFTPNNTIDNKSVKDNEENSSLFYIIADRYTCNGECILKISEDYTGEWSCNNQSVSIENIYNPETVVHFDGQDKVLFSYLYEGNTDTFTVFFQKPAELTYKISPVNCGEIDGKVEFNFPESRQFSSINEYQLEKNSFDKLSEGNYTFELKDNYTCNYQIEVNVPKVDLEGSISFEAAGTMVGSAIHFKANIEIEEANYTWDFGDGTQSFEKSPVHRYEKADSYNVKVLISNNNCQKELILNNLKIDDKGFSIPNIFTPNNDGKNDVFLISVPDNLKSFNAIIMNRDGKMVYQWTGSQKGWNGLMINGEEASSGTYYYVITGVDANGQSFEYKNFVELRR